MLLRRLTSTLLLAFALLLSTVPASAQLATGSAWQNVKSTDFLNLYQGNNSAAIKPEVLMLLDNSYSTWRMMFHPLFPNYWLDEIPGSTASGFPTSGSNASSDYSVALKFSSFPAASGTVALEAASPVNFLTIGFSTDGATVSQTVTASGVTYTIGGARTAVTGSDGKVYYVNTLIGADGYEIGYANIPNAINSMATSPLVTSTQSTTNPGKTDPVNWMLCATHMRLLLSKVDSTTTTRVIDFPLPWAPLDPPTTAWYSAYNPAVIAGTATASVGPYTPAKATDPFTLTTYFFDTQVPGVQPVSSTGSATGTKPMGVGINGAGMGTTFIRSRYIEWCFVGKDPSSTGGAAYCIPNAIPSTVAADMYAVPANVIPYNPPATGTWAPGPGYTYNGPLGAWQTKGWTQFTTGTTAFSNLIPNRTRVNSIKECVIKTWLNHQKDIMLAVRIFDAASSQTANNSLTSSKTAVPAASTSNWLEMDASSQATIANQVGLIAGMGWATDGTPLGQSMLGCLAQFTNPTAFSASIATAGYSTAQLNCQHHFLIIITDGASDEGSMEAGVTLQTSAVTNYPYYQQSGSYANAAFTGNGLIKNSPSLLTSTYWNLPTLAGIGAHGGDGSSTNPTWIQSPLSEYQGTNYPGNFTTITSGGLVPFWVTQRTVAGNVVNLSPGQAIQTMTVGVSLGVNYYSSGTTILTSGSSSNTNLTAPNLNTMPVPVNLDFTAAKFELLASAAFGDPNSKNYTIASVVPFYLAYGSTLKTPDATYFFDGRDPASLVQNLDSAITAINQISGVNSSSAPVFPTLGAGLGNEVYVGNFLPPVTPGPLWTGDLLAYPTTTSSVGTLLLDNSGNQITGALSASTAQWSAAAVIGNRGWLNRRIYTRLPSTSSTWNPSIVRVNMGAAGTDQTQGYSTISSLLPGGASALTNWQFFTGADTSSGSSPLSTRLDSIMGDIIGSTPTVLQYAALPSTVQSYSTALANAWSGHTNPAFRVIFVGDNQGLFHAFGEVSWTDTTTNASQAFTKSVADELFAFAPTEILPYINVINGSGNKHYYAVDGAPTVYLLDLPQNSTQATGNGMFDASNSYATEKAIVVFGLGKGGRSYYALNVADPVNPTMAWALCPNEGAYNYPSSRVGGSVSTAVIANMGLATSQPSFARVATSNDGGVANKIIDAVLIGGGYSDWNIESSLPATAVTNTTSNIACYPATGTQLGRSVIAMDVSNGQIIGTWALSGSSSTLPAGPVMTGLVPVTIVAGSGITERAYFTDYYGSLWALGGTTLQTGTYNMIRTDTPIIDNWAARQIYCQTVIGAVTPATGNGVISTVPVPFLLPSSPLTVTTSGVTYSPFTLGVAFETGDRNNPLDNFTYTQWASPGSAASAQNHLNVIFDRQDLTQGVNASTFTFTNLADATAASTTFDTNPGDTGYYLKHTSPGWYGYTYPLGAPVANSGSSTSPYFIPKGITSPLVLEGNLFFSTFTPTNVTCAGGGGGTGTYQLCNLLAPNFNNSAAFNTTNAASDTVTIGGCKSGLVLSWTGVASNMSARTILTGVQAGLTSGSGVTDSITSTAQNLIIQNLNTLSSDRFPKIRVWRVVH